MGNVLGIMDGPEMRKRTCPYEGHEERERFIHKTGVVMTGTITVPSSDSGKENEDHAIDIRNFSDSEEGKENGGKTCEVIARFGPAADAKPDGLWGWGIKLTDVGSSTEIEESSSLIHKEDGDFLLLGRGYYNNSIYFNDTGYIEAKTVSDFATSTFVKTAFSRTGKKTSFSRAPYRFLNIDPETRVFIMQPNSTTERFNPHQESNWIIGNAENGKTIAFIKFNGAIKGEEGNGLLFKHDLIDEKSPTCVNTCCGFWTIFTCCTLCNTLHHLCGCKCCPTNMEQL